MLKPKFTFVFSKEFTDSNQVYHARFLPNNTILVSWNDVWNEHFEATFDKETIEGYHCSY